MADVPDDYLERVYAGVLGKLVGVYLGRPFENWTYQEIQERLGDIFYYVHDQLGLPLVVIDDDVSGTFSFVRALEEHGMDANISSEQIGNTWLNQVVERRAVFWWGGNGISTEHTAFVNLKNGIAAPQSGATRTNGGTLSQQIGAQIFIDGWAMVAPGNPAFAAMLAETAARVSHDGEAVNAAKLWAAMEAEAFLSSDVNHLLDTGLKVIPSSSLIAKLVADVRHWVVQDNDWRRTRQRIEDNYGYDRYPGVCHVVPNHGIMIMALLYGSGSFHTAMHIINTCGWDTDCNSGNVACLIALVRGLDGFKDGPDWLGPLADRAIISSADGGYSINNAARIAYELANFGRKLAGQPPIPPPKGGAQFHFSLPGSVQGFQVTSHLKSPDNVRIGQCQDNGIDCLGIHMQGLTDDSSVVEVMTDTFTPLEVLKVDRNYDIMASPLVYPGQLLRAELHAATSNNADMDVRLRAKAYNEHDDLVSIDSHNLVLPPGGRAVLEWVIPDQLQNCPIQQIGLAIGAAGMAPKGSVFLHSLRWSGIPLMTLRRPAQKAESLWLRSWVSSVDKVHATMGPSFLIAQDRGEGLIAHGTRDWDNYEATASEFVVNLGANMGLAARIRGLNRYYALMLTKTKRLALVKAADENRITLASTPFDWQVDTRYDLHISVQGHSIRGWIGGVAVQAVDESYKSGAVGLIVTEGSLSTESITISP